MNLEIICASRTATGKINLSELIREAIKTKINPSLEIGRCDDVSLSKEGRGASKKISLSIDYNPPTNAVKAYEDIHNYEILSSALGNLDWDTTTAKVKNLDDGFFEKGTWYLIEETEGYERYKNQLLEGKIIFNVGIEGISLSQAQKVKFEFDSIRKCRGYRGIGIKDNLPMIYNPIVYFDTFLDSLDMEKIKTKLSLLEKLKGSCWEIRDLTLYRGRIGETDNIELLSFKKLQPSFYVRDVLLMQEDATSKRVIAKYVLKKPAE